MSGTVIPIRPGGGAAEYTDVVAFHRSELSLILGVYGRMVAAGIWRDYAIDHLRDCAIFSIFHRATEAPLFRVEKHPKLAAKQGAYSVLGADGRVLKRGKELASVLAVFDSQKMKLVR